MQLNEAVRQLAEIRLTLARAQVFRGFQSRPVMLSSMLAVVGSMIQATWIRQPLAQIQDFLTLWVSIAFVSFGMSLLVILGRIWRDSSGEETERFRRVMAQFLPPLTVGALLTIFIAVRLTDLIWLLPGLWSLLFGLAILSTVIHLPKSATWAGIYYLFAGLVVLTWGDGAQSLAPWTMLMTFGVGQFLSAVILYVALERSGVNE